MYQSISEFKAKMVRKFYTQELVLLHFWQERDFDPPKFSILSSLTSPWHLLGEIAFRRISYPSNNPLRLQNTMAVSPRNFLWVIHILFVADRLVKQRRIFSGDLEKDTNNDEGEKRVTGKEKEAQLAKQKQKEEGKTGGAGQILLLN